MNAAVVSITLLSSWGGSIELEILAAYFQCELVAIDVQTLQQYHHGDSKHSRRAFLLYNGVHYDAISFVITNHVHYHCRITYPSCLYQNYLPHRHQSASTSSSVEQQL